MPPAAAIRRIDSLLHCFDYALPLPCRQYYDAVALPFCADAAMLILPAITLPPPLRALPLSLRHYELRHYACRHAT